jgi:hypothetical protein
LHLVEDAAGQMAHLPERGFYFFEHYSGKNARQVRTEHSVIFVLVP